MFKTISKHAPPPPGVESPLLWGTEDRVRELFGDGVSEISFQRRISRQPFRSAEHYVEFFRTYFGPTQMAFERVGPEGEQALTDDLLSFSWLVIWTIGFRPDPPEPDPGPNPGPW